MPTLIRLLVILLVLVGLGYGAMFALVMSVHPADKDVTIRIPTRELVASPEREPLVRREIDTTRAVPAAETPTAETPAVTPAETPEATTPVASPSIDTLEKPAPDSSGDVVTLQQGVE
jgi:hypothetical protein